MHLVEVVRKVGEEERSFLEAVQLVVVDRDKDYLLEDILGYLPFIKSPHKEFLLFNKILKLSLCLSLLITVSATDNLQGWIFGTENFLLGIVKGL